MDASLSFDENDNCNIVSSTPKKPKLICSICGKSYILRHYYLKHLDSHSASSAPSTTATPAADQSDVSAVNLSLRDIDVSFGSIAPTVSHGSAVFKVPQPRKKPPKKVKPKFVCTYCLKGYMCQKSFNNHIMLHQVQSDASRYPNKDKILQNIEEISRRALDRVSKAPTSKHHGSFSEVVRQVHEMSTKGGLEWNNFSSGVCSEVLNSAVGHKFLLPSTLLHTLLTKVEEILSDKDKCQKFLNMLKIPALNDNQDSVQNIASNFFLEFLLNFTQEILVFISVEVRSQNSRPAKSVAELDEEDKKVIYYIGGSIIRGYFRIAYRHKSNKMWCQIAEVLKTSVLTDDVSLIVDASWTVAVNRGGLLYISEKCQEFLICLTKVVFSCEKHDGSIDFMDVINVACNGEVCVLWDQMIGTSLSENVSLQLMNDIIKFFCRTCGRGFARKRLNFLRDRPLISLTTRHLAATRKGRS